MALKRQKVNILGIEVDDISFPKAVDQILRLAEPEERGNYVVTVNSEFVMLARKSPGFLRILSKANLALPDGSGVVISKLIFGGREQSRITGVDMIQELCAKSAKRTIRVGFLGGFGHVAEIAAKRQKEKNPRLKIVFAGPGDEAIGSNLRLKKLFDKIGRVDILFVAYGMGRQEFLIDRMRKKLNVGVFIGVGGAFDLLANVKRRAPRFAQNLGLEWLWRLLLEPTRLWRMRVLPIFAILVFGQVYRRFFRNLLKNPIF